MFHVLQLVCHTHTTLQHNTLMKEMGFFYFTNFIKKVTFYHVYKNFISKFHLNFQHFFIKKNTVNIVTGKYLSFTFDEFLLENLFMNN